MQGALAFVQMPGLVAVVFGAFMVGAGALALAAGLVLLAVSAAGRSALRPAAIAAVAGGFVLGAAGAGLTWFGDAAEDGEVADFTSPLWALAGVVAAILAARYAARAAAPAQR